MKYWLMKTEPTTFGVEHLKKLPAQTTFWDGVRNYQARNFLRDDIKKGDQAFFYHSNCDATGIVGIVEVVRAGSPDPSQFDGTSHHFDGDSDPQNPRWYGVEVKLVRQFSSVMTLPMLRAIPKLSQMLILRKGNRLSVTPVTPEEWQAIIMLQ